MTTDLTNNGDIPFETLVARSMASLRLQTGIHEHLFQIDKAAWALDQDTGLITFTNPDGLVATASAQIIGTYDTTDGTWLWAWDNPSVEAKLAGDAKAARDYGNKHTISELTTAKLTISEDRCWELAAIACELAGDQGVYRGPADSTRVFIAFGAMKLSKQK